LKRLTPGRAVAIEQIAGLRMAYERRQTLPMRLAVTVVVRAPDQRTLERRTKRLKQRAKDLGAQVRLLRWEQRAGWLAVAPLRRPQLPRRGQPVETGTVARTYPFSAGTLALDGGVPFGVAASAPVTFTTAAPQNKNRHMCWYGTSGAGKGYSLRVLLSRERFANGLRVYGIDQDEQQEYAGRFCDYLDGSRVPIRTLADVEAFATRRAFPG
jgi:type IV secretory pathway VirB4 component